MHLRVLASVVAAGLLLTACQPLAVAWYITDLVGDSASLRQA